METRDEYRILVDSHLEDQGDKQLDNIRMIFWLNKLWGCDLGLARCVLHLEVVLQ
jgi:hypothetical protein